MDTGETFDGLCDDDVQMQSENMGEFDEFLVNTDETIEDEFNENVVTKIVVQESEPPAKLTIDEQAKNELYRYLDVNINENKNSGNWRLSVVHVRGVQEMSSEDILSYFSDYMPNSIEWVNDMSCNVVFDDSDIAAFVIKDLRTAVVFKGRKYSEIESCDVDIVDGDTLDMSVPPGRWLLAKPHPKAKVLLLRFATLSDKKVKGAWKFSEYYLKHGFISEDNVENEGNSMVQQFRRRINLENPSDTSNRSNKVMRMRMRADDEEDKAKKRLKPSLRIEVSSDGLSESRDVKTTENKVSVWNRLDVVPQELPSSQESGIFGNRARKGVWSRLNQPRNYEEITVTDLRLKLTERKIRFKRRTPY